jgi:hypothetical protein
MKFYHYTTKQNWQQIQQEGLVPGSYTGNGEALPFVMLSADKYEPRGPGHYVFIEVELNEMDDSWYFVNDAWIHYHGTIKPKFFTAVMIPPNDNAEVFAAYKEGGDEAVNAMFEYKEID